jgi:hypothetical protein
MLAIGIGEYGFPKIIILYNECGKLFFLNHVLYWQWIDELPAPMLEEAARHKINLDEPDLCEDLPVEERTPARLERRAKIRKALVEKDAEELRLKQVRFENWVQSGKPTDDPMDYAKQTGIGHFGD